METLQKRTVLIVEDEAIIRFNACDILGDGDFEVIEAEDAAAAILAAEGRPEIHLLFTDVNMPGVMNGIDLAEHLLGLRPDLKIIITSALPLLRPVAHLKAHFLTKPYAASELCAVAKTMLAA